MAVQVMRYRFEAHHFLAEQFEARRTHLHAVAYRMLGSLSEADDAVRESWSRVSRSDPGRIDSLGDWLTTVVGRVCLDKLRSRPVDPDREGPLADSVGLALLTVLETLSPAERLAFVLHDLFGMLYEEIALVVDRAPATARQLAGRARRRVRGLPPASEADRASRREVVEAS